MPIIRPSKFDDDIAARGRKAVEQIVLPKLGPEDHGKFIAVDVDTGEFETDMDQDTVLTRIREKYPNARVWLARAGYPAAAKIRLRSVAKSKIS